jgi:tryptophan-rich sensory protein
VGWGPALALWGAQLALNGAWSWLFFGLHKPGLALAEILVLWIAIAVTIAVFLSVRRVAGLLLVPYLAWVSFAALLNGAIWQLNR